MTQGQHMRRIRQNGTGRPIVDLGHLVHTPRHEEASRLMGRHGSSAYGKSIDNVPSYGLDDFLPTGHRFERGNTYPLVVA